MPLSLIMDDNSIIRDSECSISHYTKADFNRTSPIKWQSWGDKLDNYTWLEDKVKSIYRAMGRRVEFDTLGLSNDSSGSDQRILL